MNKNDKVHDTLFAERDETYILEGYDQEYKDEKDNSRLMDPSYNFNFARQVAADTQIKDISTTPLDKTHYCQTLTNPLTKASDGSYQVITVQRLRENIRQLNKDERQHRHLYLSCLNKEHKLTLIKDVEKDPRTCSYCQGVFKSNKTYRCAECGNFDICLNCQSKSFVRRNIEKKTSRHRFYEHYHMQERKNLTNLTMFGLRGTAISDEKLKKLDLDTRKYIDRKMPLSTPFANLTKTNENKSKHHLSSSSFSQRAIIGLWQKNKKGFMKCYKQFMVQSPLFFAKDPKFTEAENYFTQSGLVQDQTIHYETETLLHVGKDKQVYFFQCNEDHEVEYVEINLERAMGVEFADYTQDEKDLYQDDNLEEIHRHLFHIPQKNKILFGGDVQLFCKNFFRIKDRQVADANRLPQLFTANDKTYLCLQNPYDVDPSKASIFTEPKKPHSSSLLFIDLKKPEAIAKIAINTWLLLSVQENEEHGLYFWLYRRDKVMNKTSDDSLHKVKWEHLTDFKNAKTAQKKAQTNIIDYKVSYDDDSNTQAAHGYWLASPDIQGKVNKDENKCTIIFGSKDYFVLSLGTQAFDHQIEQGESCAKQIMEHTPAPDCRFAEMEDDPERNFIICNLQRSNDYSTSSFMQDSSLNTYTMEIYDLDQVNQKKNQLKSLYSDEQEDDRQITVFLPSNFNLCDHNKGKLHEPFKFMTFQLFYKQQDWNKIPSYSFVNTLFYTSHNDKELQVIFVKGHQNQIEEETANRVDYQPQSIMQRDFIVKWPILIRNSHLPMRNQLLVSNFAQNVPQMKIDLGDFIFLKFVESKYPEPFADGKHTNIFFLVLTPDREAVRLMYFSTFAWPIVEHNNHIKAQKDTLHIVSGSVTTKDDPLFQKLLINSILQANLIHHRHSDRGQQISIVIQLQDRLASFNLHTQQPGELICAEPGDVMVRLPMISAPNNKLYYVKRSLLVDQVMKIEAKGTKIVEKIVHEQASQIVQIQMTDPNMRQDNDNIFVLNNDCDLIEIGCDSNQNNIFSQDKLYTKSTTKVIGADSLFTQLRSHEWQKIVMSQRMITYQELKESDSSTGKQPISLVSHNLKSQTRIQHEFLDYHADAKQFLYHNGHSQNKEQWALASNQKITSIQAIENVNKTLSFVQEGSLTYFMVQQALDKRQIEIFDQKRSTELVKGLEFVGNRIAVNMPGQTLFFNQYDMMLSQVQPFKISKYENQFSQHIETEYYKLEFEDKNAPKPVIKLDSNNRKDGYQYKGIDRQVDGFQVVRATTPMMQFKERHKAIDKIFEEQDYLKSGLMKPTPIMDNDGQCVSVLYFKYLHPEKTGENLLKNTASYINVEQAQEEEKNKKLDKSNLKSYIYEVKYQALKISQEEDEFFQQNALETLFEKDQQDIQYIVRWVGQQAPPNSTPDELIAKQIQYCKTKDYLVIKDNQNIYFCDIKVIKKANKQALQKLSKTSTDLDEMSLHHQNSLEQPLLSKSNVSNIDDSSSISNMEQLKQIILDNHCEVQFQRIDTTELLNDRIKQSDFKVCHLNASQIKLCDHLYRRDNLIQIMFCDITLIWDLKNNKQLKDVIAPHHFSTPQTYTTMGVNINVNENSLTGNNVENNGIIAENQELSLFIRPKVDKDDMQDRPLIFRLFTYLDLMEIAGQLVILKNLKYPKIFDLEAILANLNGRTYFEIMREKSGILKRVRSQLQKDEEYQTKVCNKNNIEYDNTYIRRLHKTLNIPLQGSSSLDEAEDHMQPKLKKGQAEPKQKQVHLEPSGVSIKSQGEDKMQYSFPVGRFRESYPFIKNPKQISLLHEAIRDKKFENRSLLESLLGLYLQSSEVRMVDLIDEFEDFERSFHYSSNEISEFMEFVFSETEMTKQLQYIQWPGEQNQIIFGAKTSQLSSEKIEDKIQGKFESYKNRKSLSGCLTRLQTKLGLNEERRKFVRVNIRVIEISWLVGDMGKFFEFLSGVSDESIFDMNMVKVLLKEQRYSNQLTMKVFLPWCIYFLTSLLYMSTYAANQKTVAEENLNGYGWIMRSIMLTGITLFMSIEAYQMHNLGPILYLADFWNWVYLLIYGFSVAVMAENVFGGEVTAESDLSTTLASICAMLLWIGLFYWLRLFETFSKYIFLIMGTFNDVRHFLLLFFIVLLCFANGLYILDLKQVKYEFDWEANPDIPNLQPSIASGGKVVDTIFGYGFIDTFVNQYMLGLGDFATDRFEDNTHDKLIWLMFIMASFITNIVFLNMLIAIMGDTYAKVSQSWDRYALIERTCIFSDHWPLIRLSKEFKNQQFLYIATALDDQEIDEEEALNNIKETLQTKFEDVQEKQKKNQTSIDEYKRKTELSMSKLQQENVEIKEFMQTMKDQLIENKDSIKQMKDILIRLDQKN